MAISLTMSEFNLYEPMRKNKYAVKFQNFVSGTGIGAFESLKKLDDLTVACHRATMPEMTVEATSLERLNDRSYLPTKAEFNSVEVDFYEYIKDINAFTKNNAGDILWEWQKLIYDPTTGVMRPKRQISANVLVMQFDGIGNIIRTWNLYGAWPTAVTFDELEDDTADIQSVKATFRYDWADMMNYSFAGNNSNDSANDGTDDSGDTNETTTPSSSPTAI